MQERVKILGKQRAWKYLRDRDRWREGLTGCSLKLASSLKIHQGIFVANSWKLTSYVYNFKSSLMWFIYFMKSLLILNSKSGTIN